ncbi:MAG: methionine--tRNA ligase [Candidatus Pacebacteria bacterium]|nr:methionine--tRNA ligase [Candidatus Paceibacterota bacterium]
MKISNGRGKNSFYITTTLPYVNAPLHMGHALELVRADAIARYKKLIGCDVYFNTGTDEHGIKIYEKAAENNLKVQDFVDQGFTTFKEQLKMFGISGDAHFVRTTDLHHESAAQEFWQRVNKNGFIYKKNYESKYCVGCESEKTDSELDQNGECLLHPGRKVEIIKEENYFFKYSAFTERLLEFYEKNPNFVVPDFRYNEIKSFVKNGLQDFSISRLKSKMPWGIPVPGNSEHVMYVWFDALTNYISTLGWPENTEQFEKYWINGTPTQYCGKDNTRFQAAMWQAMLMAAELPNSYQIVVDGFITGEGGVRMSKTLGNVIDPRDVVAEYGVEALRYFLLKEVSSFEDSPFTMERFKDAYNSGLANGLGNLTSRILTLSEKYLEKCPEIPEKSDFTKYFSFYEKFDVKQAADFVWNEIAELDKFIQKTEPFKVIKVDEKKGKELISDMVVRLYEIARMLNPIMPETNILLKKLIKENKKPEHPLFLRKD